MAKFIVGSDSNSVTNTGEAWIFRASDRPVGTLTQQLGGNGCSTVSWEIVDSAWSKVIASISNGAPGSSLQINNSGYVGLGIGSPGANLHMYSTGQPNVSCGLYATQILQTDSQANYQRIRFDRDSCAFWGIGVEGANSSNDLIISGLIGGKTSGTWSDNVFKIKNSTGNVGINCSDPNNKLTIAGTNAILGVITATTAGSSYAIFRNTADTIAGYIGLDGNGLVGAENGSMLMASSAGKSIIFAPALTEKMKITSAGNVGINCTSPGSKLTVGGTLTTTDTITTTSGTVNTIISWNASVGIIGTDTNHGLQIRTCGTERIRITCNGEIGINTTSPGSYKLNVNGAFYAAGSSCEYKTQICQYNTDSCMFMKLTPVTYQYKDEYCHLGKELKSGTQIGLIAEDVAEVYPELAILKDEEDNKVVRNVDYEKLSIILLSELQKLRAEVDELKSK